MTKFQLKQEIMPQKELYKACKKGILYAIVDAHFGPWRKLETVALNPKDTDPLFFDMIAWENVTYKPPFLIKPTVEDLDYILTEFSNDRWGIFLYSHAEPYMVVDHFQKFVIARGPDGDPYFFKFQDGGVLDVFLNRWSASELNVFFGLAEAFAITSLDSQMVTKFKYCDARGRSLRPLPIPEDCLIDLKKNDLDACYQRIEEDLVKVISWHLRNEHSHLVKHLDQNLLEQRVYYGIKKGRSYSLESVADLAGFVGLMFEVGPNFDQHAKIQKILKSPRQQGTNKLDQLLQGTDETDWAQAASQCDYNAWPKKVVVSKPKKKKTGS